MPRIQTRRPGGTQISEVASAGESLGGLWPRSLIDGEPLRPGVRYLHTAPVRNLEIHADLDLAAAELRDCPIETLDAVDEDWLIAREMPGEQERGRIRGQPHHRHPCAEGLNREYDLRGQTAGEVLHAGGDIPAGQELKSSRSNIPRAYARRNRDPSGGACRHAAAPA